MAKDLTPEEIRAERERYQRECGEAPGRHWRLACEASESSMRPAFEAEDRGEFDELVVGHWFHMERMDKRTWWMRIGDLSRDRVFDITINPDGTVDVYQREDE